MILLFAHQSSHFLRGFQQLIQKDWVSMFNEHELQVAEMVENGEVVGVVGGRIKCVWTGYEGTHVRVISGHLGWVRSIAFDPSNTWFCTGSADRTIKIWDVGSGRLKLTLSGHIEQVRGLAVSQHHTYMFSAGDVKLVKCWDLEQNKAIRSYHGHVSGVYCLALHPTLDILLTGGRDSVCRVWDIHSKSQIYALSGHDNTVCSVFTRPTDPQVVTGSHGSTIKFWDLRHAAAGKTMATLTHHKKSVRAMTLHPTEYLQRLPLIQVFRSWNYWSFLMPIFCGSFQL